MFRIHNLGERGVFIEHEGIMFPSPYSGYLHGRLLAWAESYPGRIYTAKETPNAWRIMQSIVADHSHPYDF